MPNVDPSILREFASISGASEAIADKYLRRYNQSLTHALDGFYADGHQPTASVAEVKRRKRTSKAEADRELFSFYATYAERASDQVTPDGIERLSTDLGIDPLDVIWLVIACHCEAKTMGNFTREEWLRGMRSLDCVSLSDLKESLPPLRETVRSNADELKRVYLFAFQFALDHGARNISLDTAIARWPLLLPLTGWSLSSEWLRYVQSDSVVSKSRAISRDAWTLLLAFAKAVPNRDALTCYDRDGGAWPVLIDEFFDFLVGK